MFTHSASASKPPAKPAFGGTERLITITDDARLPQGPAPAAEQQRIDAVRRYSILDTPPDGAFDRIAELAALFFTVPVSTVSIVDEDRVWFKAAHGLTGVTQVGTDPGLCTSVVTRDGTYVRGHPRRAEHHQPQWRLIN